MKTLSQNTTSSACAPETDLQQLVATLVPDEQRISFWPQHFGLIPQWVTLEPRVFGWMDRLCEDYCGGIWNLYTLNNGGAFMAPEPDDDDDETWVLFSAMKSVLSPPCHISLSSINLSTPLTCDRRPAKAVPTGMETIC